MKVSVCCEILYTYEIDVPDNEDIETYCDACDPVYREVCGTMADAHLNFTGRVVSIVDSVSNEVYYAD